MGVLRTGLALVAALDLENVEKVGRRGVDLDEILVILGSRVRQLRDLEVRRALCNVMLISNIASNCQGHGKRERIGAP